MSRTATSCVRAAALGFVAASCTSVMSVNRYAELMNVDPGQFASLTPGTRLVVYPNTSACDVYAADSRSLVAKPEATLLWQQDWATRPSIQTIDETAVHPADSDPWVAVQIHGADNQTRWLRFSAGSTPSCVAVATDPVVVALEWIGRRLTFAPWKAECREIAAVGKSVASTLLEAETAGPFEVTSVDLGSPFAEAFSRSNRDGAVPWLVLGPNLQVRADTAQTCFAAGDDAVAKRPSDAAALLHLKADTCTQADDNGAPHLECNTAVGAWEGAVSDRAVQLRLVRRNLGTLHFYKGRPVDGARYADAVVALTTSTAASSWTEGLYDAVKKQIAETARSSPSGDVRVVSGNVAGASYRVHVEVVGVKIHDVREGSEEASSQFEARRETRINPEKDVARRKEYEAQTNLRNAQAAYNNGVEEAKQSQRLCEAAAEQAHQAASNIGGTWGLVAGLATDAANVGCQIAVMPSMDPVVQAQVAVSQASANYASTPDTIEVPIMETWRYRKKTYSRTINATLRVITREEGGTEPTAVSTPMTYTWRDFEVAADPQHNVDGHAPDRAPMDRPEALVPLVAKELSQRLELQLKAALSRSLSRAAKAGFRDAGGEPAAPEHELVDIAAFGVAQKRLVKAVRRGRSQLKVGSGGPSLQILASDLGLDQCLLVAVVPEGDEFLRLRLISADRRWGDLRGTSPAILEMCPSAGDLPSSLELTSEDTGTVRWGVYLTRRKAGAAADQSATKGKKTAPIEAPGPSSLSAPGVPETTSEVMQ
jgi:hypothetical protein